MIGSQIRFARKSKSLTQDELSEISGVAREQISRYEKGKITPDVDTVIKIANALDLPLRYFLDDEDDGQLLLPSNLIKIERKAIPIVGEIACGTPITADENIEGYADVPQGIHADFALRCKGDSMAPTFLDGDLVLIRKQPDVDDGQIAAVLIDGEATLKHVYHQQGGLLLVADNAKYTPIHLHEDECEYISVQGQAVGFVRMFSKE